MPTPEDQMAEHQRMALAPGVLARLAEAVAAARDNEEAFAAVATVAHSAIGHHLMTIMAYDAARDRVRRIFSTNPDAYPVGGSKTKRDTPWSRQVLLEGRPFIGHDAQDIRQHFADHGLIADLGLTSILNMPVRIPARTVGTLNLLHMGAAHYRESDLVPARILALALAGPLAAMQL